MQSSSLDAFFALLKAGLWEEEVHLSQLEIVDYNEVYRLAEEQAVIGLVAAGLEHVVDSTIPKEVALRFVGQTLQLERRNLAMNAFIGDIVKILYEKKISVLLVKGQGLAQCYERPLWRSCGDVDFLLDTNSYKNAKTVLIPMATSVEPEGVGAKHQGLIIDSWVIELHGTLRSGLSSRIDKVIATAQMESFQQGGNRLWQNQDTHVFLPNPDNDVIFIFTHFIRHFFKGGIGLRQICDWCRLLWIYRFDLDLQLLESRINRMRLMTEWKAFGSLATDYLGFPADSFPFYDSKYKGKGYQIMMFIVEVGNFGHNRDMSYFSSKSYFVRKTISFWRILGDLCRHSRLFPIDSLRFFPSIFVHGLMSAVRGE